MSVCYIDAALRVDVMFEQLEYLISHRDPSCMPDCEDCRRLAIVEAELLGPFCSTGARALRACVADNGVL